MIQLLQALNIQTTVPPLMRPSLHQRPQFSTTIAFVQQVGTNRFNSVLCFSNNNTNKGECNHHRLHQWGQSEMIIIPLHCVPKVRVSGFSGVWLVLVGLSVLLGSLILVVCNFPIGFSVILLSWRYYKILRCQQPHAAPWFRNYRSKINFMVWQFDKLSYKARPFLLGSIGLL